MASASPAVPVAPPTSGTNSPLHSPPPSSTVPARPRGILKNSVPSFSGSGSYGAGAGTGTGAGAGAGAGATTTPSTTPAHLTWDEANLLETEIQKDSLMKITEPKTPYVRYNAETDEIEGMGEIPPFNLDGRSRSPSNFSLSNPVSPQIVTSPLAETDSRRASFGNSTRSSGSASSSRRTSFNLPNSSQIITPVRDNNDGAVEFDEEMDEETAARHAAFVRARGRHYSNEAEALKRAKQLIAEEEDDAADDESKRHHDDEMAETLDDGYEHEEDGGDPNGGIPPIPPLPRVNGIPPQNRH